MSVEQHQRREECIGSEDTEAHCWEAIGPVRLVVWYRDGEEEGRDRYAESAKHEDVVDLDASEDLRGYEDGYDYDVSVSGKREMIWDNTHHQQRQ